MSKELRNVFSVLKMESNTRVSGTRIIKRMEKGFKFGKMVHYMKDIGKAIKQMV